LPFFLSVSQTDDEHDRGAAAPEISCDVYRYLSSALKSGNTCLSVADGALKSNRYCAKPRAFVQARVA
jgi:hypothetical protein